MTRALFKKQMLEVFVWLYKDHKTGKLRTKRGIIGYGLLYFVLFGVLGVIFGAMAEGMCEPLLLAERGWMYWCIMGLIGVLLGVFGSVFNTYSSLYQAKDNDLLLSLPVPVRSILLVRLSGVYVIGLMYELLVLLPAVLVWFVHAPLSAAGVIHVLLIPIVLSFFVLVLSAVVGWVVALVAGRLKHKSLVIVCISLVFIGAYYYAYAKLYGMMQELVMNAVLVSEDVKNALYPFYLMGRAAEGDVFSMLIFTAMVALLLAIVYAVLSRSFLKLATTNRGGARAVYKERTLRAGSVQSALLKKELRRFSGSANYMLNCGLGTLFMPIGAILLIWKADMLRTTFALFPQELVLLLVAAGCCGVAGFNDITSPSVSLEGKNLWIAQSLPVSPAQVLTAKLQMHLLLTLPAAAVLVAAAEWLICPQPAGALLLPVLVALYVTLTALSGLLLNLRMPNLTWSSEVVPIKQSASVMISLFGSWVLIAAAAGLYYLLHGWISSELYLMLVAVLLLAADLWLFHLMKTWGARTFAAL